MARVIDGATVMTSGPKRNETVTEAKLLKLLVSKVRALSGSVASRPSSAAQGAEQERLAQEGDQDVELGEAEGAHRADLAGPRADGGEHRVGRGEHGAEGQEDGDQRAGALEEEARAATGSAK